MDRKRKRELRNINLSVWEGAHDVFPTSASLDSSLKKNTAFIKRLRTGITPSAQAGFVGEIKTLSLQKYLSEVITATAEGVSRLKTTSEVAAAVETVSALHQRFGPADFTKQLGWLLGRGLTSPDKNQVKQWTQEVKEREEKERLARHRVLLRLVTEFWLCGILRSLDDVEGPEDASTKSAKEGTSSEASKSSESQKLRNALNGIKNDNMRDHDPFPLEVLKDLLGHDSDLQNLPLAVLFVKNFAWDILGIRPPSEDSRKQVDADGEITNERDVSNDTDDSPIIAENVRQRFLNVIDRYTQFLKKRLVRDQQLLSTQGKRNAEAYIRSGEVFEDRQNNFEKQQKSQEKLVANAQILCEILGQDMPDLSDKNGADFASSGTVGIVKAGDVLRGSSDGAGIWEDEDERRFYENLIDLRGRVPAILLDDSKKSKSEVEDGAQTRPTDGGPVKAAETDEASMQIANKSVGAQVDTLLVRLPDLVNKEQVDSVAHDFCFLNSKASRNRLLKSLQDVPKARSDLLPLYARLIATLGQYMPDLVQGIISHLDDEFRSLQRRKSKEFLGQVRLMNMRYLAELIKFGVVPEHVIFHCFKVSLDDFSRMNIEIIANFLENCGRYLLRNPETSPRMASFLETLSRKKSAQHLGAQERMLLENALYYVDPPERAAIEQKERTPTELFIRQLVYYDITKRNYMKILKTIRKLHWEEKEVVDMLEKIFSKPGKVKFSSVHLLAVLLGALSRYHQDFAITIIDNVLESIMLGLEQNDFKFNQRRIAEVKYLGELYNYKMVDSSVIFDTLYRIVTFGHEGGTPVPDRAVALDMPDDFFRIRLVCTMLETCGMCFDRGSSRKKLDFFLAFFQYYVLTKDTLPMEIDFLLQDTYTAVRPQWTLVTDLEEAARIFGESVQAKYKQQPGDRAAEDAEEAEDSESDDELGDEENAARIEAHDSSEEDDNDDGDHNSNDEPNAHPLSDDEEIIVVREEEKIDPEAEAEFDREFAAMMAESLGERKHERQSRFDVPLPIRKAQRAQFEVNEQDSAVAEEIPAPPSTMSFQLMTRKGNRQQTRTLDLPSDSHFALSMKSQQAAEREEQQRIKNLVLNYDLGDDDQHDGTAALDDFFSSQKPFPAPEKLAKSSSIIGYDPHFGASLSRLDRNGRAPRARRLNLSDVDWYAHHEPLSEYEARPQPGRMRNQHLSRSTRSQANRPNYRT